MHDESTRALYRAHATARLRGDTAGARRLAARLGREGEAAHLLFVLHLLASVVFDELGTAPDPCDLAELTKRLHDKHYREGGTFRALHAEAMIRACFDEGHLLAEIPFNEQAGYMWAVMEELTEPGISDADLAEHFEMAEEVCSTSFVEAYARVAPEVPGRGVPAGSEAPGSKAGGREWPSGPAGGEPVRSGSAAPEPPVSGPDDQEVGPLEAARPVDPIAAGQVMSERAPAQPSAFGGAVRRPDNKEECAS
ncbi:hypothetical protein [Glycomyces sp. NRRL B-16210]|uniref:hypothetical protein n=1 Tax=Glycomyces sp. NRRL B-16210 TaxID=1463821 RepID=UPI0004C04347|nr:hypothetical protein [Glycomyces sp. NRRL B-16210]